jgi:2-oxoisovalerate dehydrogenase E2 component (dihydrolipoyl transacylase)
MRAAVIKEFRLPDLGEGLTESEILSWKVGVGDSVALNQVIAEVETAKAVVELPSPFAGVIKALHEQPGTVVEVGKPIVSFEVESDDDAPAASAASTPSVAQEAEGAPAKREPNLVGYGAVVESTGHPVRRPRTFQTPTVPATAPASPATAAVTGPAADIGAPEAIADEPAAVTEVPAERPRSTPPVRKLAKDLGVDLMDVTGTGPGGLITREDVRNFVGGGGVSSAAAPSDGREMRTPIKGVRKFTAAAMVSSAFTAPHVTEFLTVDVTAAMELLDKLKAGREFAGHKLTPLTLVAKSVLLALKRNPSLNSRWDEAAQEIVQFNYVNLGIAVATPRGLLVPNVKDADRMDLAQLATAVAALADAAREGKTTPAELAGGTISITNIGVFGIDAGTPILNPGEAAILAMGAVRRMPWEHQGAVALRQVMTLSLSFDHRLVDGEQGSRFLADVGMLLSEPGMALAMF